MPANLTPEYARADQRYRQAATDAVGRKARALVTSKFSPQAVAEAYEVLYEDIHA